MPSNVERLVGIISAARAELQRATRGQRIHIAHKVAEEAADAEAYRVLPQRGGAYEVLASACAANPMVPAGRHDPMSSQTRNLLDRLFRQYSDRDIDAVEKFFAPARFRRALRDLEEFRDRAGGLPPPEAAPDDPFGQWAFPDNRKRTRQLGVDEPDTEAEEHAHEALTAYVMQNRQPPADVANMIRQLVRAGKYKETLAPPPPGAIVYRGMNVPQETLEAFQAQAAAGTWTYKARGTVSGWTYDRSVAVRTFTDAGDDSLVGIVLTARCDDNPDTFVSCVGGLYTVEPMGDMSHEKEAIAFDDVVVAGVETP